MDTKLPCFFLCSCLFLLSSCTLGPDYKTPRYPLPEKFSTAIQLDKKVAVNQFWWRASSDPVLAALVEKALSGSNLDLQSGYAQIRSARAQLGIAQADFFPSLDVHANVKRDRLSGHSEIIAAFPSGFIPLLDTDYKAGFDAAWELDFFGYTRRQTEAARHDVESIIASQYNVAIATAAEVAKDYTLYRAYQQRIKITQETIALYGETLRIVKLRYNAGEATTVDVARVQSDWLAAKANLPSLQAEARATVAGLAVLTGDLPETLIARLARPKPIPRFNPNQLRGSIPAEVLLRRPDVQQAERNLAAATARIGAAKANMFPRIQLIANLGFDTTIPGTYLQKLSQYWSLGPQISLPIFQGGRLLNAMKASYAQRDAAEAAYKKAILNALADVESSLIRYQAEREREARLYASYRKLKAVLRLTHLRYRSGEIPLTDVLDIQREMNAIHDQYMQSRGNVTINLVGVYKALGGGWC